MASAPALPTWWPKAALSFGAGAALTLALRELASERSRTTPPSLNSSDGNKNGPAFEHDIREIRSAILSLSAQVRLLTEAVESGFEDLRRNQMESNSAAVSQVCQPPEQADHITSALRNYELFHGLPKGGATLQQVESSAEGLESWASAQIDTPQARLTHESRQLSIPTVRVTAPADDVCNGEQPLTLEPQVLSFPTVTVTAPEENDSNAGVATWSSQDASPVFGDGQDSVESSIGFGQCRSFNRRKPSCIRTGTMDSIESDGTESGYPVPEPMTENEDLPTECPSCGNTFMKDAKFCRKCGEERLAFDGGVSRSISFGKTTSLAYSSEGSVTEELEKVVKGVANDVTIKEIKNIVAREGEANRDELEGIKEALKEMRAEFFGRQRDNPRVGSKRSSAVTGGGNNTRGSLAPGSDPLFSFKEPTPSPCHRPASDFELLEDPRRTIAAFFMPGDTRGPLGVMDSTSPNMANPRSFYFKRKSSANLSPITESKMLNEASEWFAVFRPTWTEAIHRMVMEEGTGKGFNVKGKSARAGPLSGFVPFLQINDNDHKNRLCSVPKDTRLQIFYQNKNLRELAVAELESVAKDMMEKAEEALNQQQDQAKGLCTLEEEEQEEMIKKLQTMVMDNPSITKIDFYRRTPGIELSERLFREAYITRPDMATPPGWYTGRKSAPMFTDMNIKSIRASMRAGENRVHPNTVLFQYHKEDPMSPHALLVAYADQGMVKPVVSDFDAFLVGSSGMVYKPMAEDQIEVMKWSLDRAEEILKKPSTHSWTSRWSAVLKKHHEYQPKLPKMGFGDEATQTLFEHLCQATKSTGAVRHGAECFNFSFPQELDNEYMVIGNLVKKDYRGKPWIYMEQQDLRTFLMERIKEGFAFPMNPVWVIRDEGWYDVWQALLQSPDAKEAMECWYPAKHKVRERIEDIHQRFPDGFQQHKRTAEILHDQSWEEQEFKALRQVSNDIENMGLDACEAQQLGHEHLELRRTLVRARRKLRIIILIIRMWQRHRRQCASRSGTMESLILTSEMSRASVLDDD